MNDIEAVLPNGLQWPEGATHYNHNYGGFFLNTNDNTVSFGQGIWKAFAEVTLEYWVDREETVVRHAVVKKQQPKAEEREAKLPPPHKQVGWWN